MINVTKAHLPDKSLLMGYIDRMYQNHWLTNDGENVQELEKQLREYLGVKHLVLVSNGTLALQIAYKALGISGDVITTPFSFVATTSSLVWEGLNPVFADIDRVSLNIDSESVKKCITPHTSAILGVHVYGRPCNVEGLHQIAKENNLRLIYDAAHAFGVKYGDQSLLNFGDISTLSFHATKIFHTIEGGAIITPHEDVYHRIKLLINFGISGPDKVTGLGINAKMNEFQAAMGLCNLREIFQIISTRKMVYERYIGNLPKSILLEPIAAASLNYSYFPVLLDSENTVLRVQGKLKAQAVNTRRYFFPPLNRLNYVKSSPCPVAEDVTNRVLCLPIFSDLSLEDVDRICSVLIDVL
jgi:dTDP-4-amino-4,6-dideoxygalactose transaminase